MDYVFEKGTNKLLLVGDTAQLPPVSQALSPSLNTDYLAANLACDVTEVQMRQVMRQAEQSGILMNATELREQLGTEKPGATLPHPPLSAIFTK